MEFWPQILPRGGRVCYSTLLQTPPPSPHLTHHTLPDYLFSKQFLSFPSSALVSDYARFLNPPMWNYLLRITYYTRWITCILCKLTDLAWYARWLICVAYATWVTEVKLVTPWYYFYWGLSWVSLVFVIYNWEILLQQFKSQLHKSFDRSKWSFTLIQN